MRAAAQERGPHGCSGPHAGLTPWPQTRPREFPKNRHVLNPDARGGARPHGGRAWALLAFGEDNSSLCRVPGHCGPPGPGSQEGLMVTVTNKNGGSIPNGGRCAHTCGQVGGLRPCWSQAPPHSDSDLLAASSLWIQSTVRHTPRLIISNFLGKVEPQVG